MRTYAAVGVIMLLGALSTAPLAQEKEEEVDCLGIVSKHMFTLGDLTLRESKPTGRCALARFGVERHQELLRSFNIEPEKCRQTDLGKKHEETLRLRIRQETRSRDRYCRRR